MLETASLPLHCRVSCQMAAPPAHSIDGEREFFVPALVMRLLAILPGGFGGVTVFASYRGKPGSAKDVCSSWGFNSWLWILVMILQGSWMATKTECGTWGAHRTGNILGRVGSGHLDKDVKEVTDIWLLKDPLPFRTTIPESPCFGSQLTQTLPPQPSPAWMGALKDHTNKPGV